MSQTLNAFAPSLGGSQFGVTLVELVLVVVMAGIVLALGVPSLQSLLQRNRLTSDTNRFVTSMMLARSEAVKRGIQTGIAAQSGDWNNGWVVWVDTDDDGVQDGPEFVLRSAEEVDSGVTLSSAGSFTVFRYEPDGTLKPDGGTLNMNTKDILDVCDSTTTGETGRQISLALRGRVSVDSEHPCP